MQKITLGSTGLRKTLGRDYGIEERYSGIRIMHGIRDLPIL